MRRTTARPVIHVDELTPLTTGQPRERHVEGTLTRFHRAVHREDVRRERHHIHAELHAIERGDDPTLLLDDD